ncbi:hypothetical protein T492DRAFT_979580 [Pavlovales sp. CCMP2436]|nr:hypothetical protein T492DRAFT_979580 [Pavlovales sp. CCMP2436]
MEVERARRASSSSRFAYQPSFAAAGKSTSTSSAAGSVQTSRPSERGEPAGWRGEEYDEEYHETAPPTPIGQWVPARPRAAQQRDAFTEPAFVHGERHRTAFQSRVEYEPQLRSRTRTPELYSRAAPPSPGRSSTPEPQLRSAARNLNPQSMGPKGSDFLGAGTSPYASQRQSVPARGPPSWQSEECEYEYEAGGEALPALPSKSELHQYMRELVEAKSELRDHFRQGAFAGVKVHYGSRLPGGQPQEHA